MSKSAQPRARVLIITPRASETNAGNWHTAARWARFLRRRYRVEIAQRWDGRAADCLIALHARRSAGSIRAFATARPGKPLIVVLTGTDLYRDIRTDRSAQRSLELATHLVVLNELGARALPARLRKKAQVILQSAAPLKPHAKPRRRLTVAVVGHLRAEKDPRLVWNMLGFLDRDMPLRVLHAGAAFDVKLGRTAAAVAAKDSRYVWLDNQPRARARQLIRRAHLLLHPSVIEGGAHVVIEALTAGTPVIASRIDGNVGLLGREYKGLFQAGNAAAAARLVERAWREPGFMRDLVKSCAHRAMRFVPEREKRAVTRLVDNAIEKCNRKIR